MKFNVGKLKPGDKVKIIMTGSFTAIDFEPWNHIIARDKAKENSPLNCPGCNRELERMYRLEYKDEREI